MIISKGLLFQEQKNIIQNIFEKYDASFDTIKFRKYYKCDKITNNFEKAGGNLEMADENFLMRLADFTNKFNEEFYGKIEPKSYGINVVMNGIMKKNLFQWNIESNPVAILQVNYDDFDFPLIGFVYVDQNFRNKKISTSIVYEVTKGLLFNGFKECMLYTDGNNIYSNKSFINSGYKLVGEYVSYYKKE
ncbi:GNAT family N-acetyltransferase [Cloacibacterium sp.]|uniref:GNAT family N-acetyltransferase n=1 Tax=Cloacibacterium sp. TaxID=1913682 RepID=UPI0039E68417